MKRYKEKKVRYLNNLKVLKVVTLQRYLDSHLKTFWSNPSAIASISVHTRTAAENAVSDF